MKKLYRYSFAIAKGESVAQIVDVFAPDINMAAEIFDANYGQTTAWLQSVRPANKRELREISNTGGPHPRHKKS